MTMENYEWIESFDKERRDELYEFYQKEWWTSDRQFSEVEQMLAHSDIVIGCCSGDGRLIGFSRILTDFIFKAMIFDVIVHSDFRDCGVGRAILDRIHTHPLLKSVKSFELYCPERLVPFYEKLGFVKGSAILLSRKR